MTPTRLETWQCVSRTNSAKWRRPVSLKHIWSPVPGLSQQAKATRWISTQLHYTTRSCRNLRQIFAEGGLSRWNIVGTIWETGNNKLETGDISIGVALEKSLKPKVEDGWTWINKIFATLSASARPSKLQADGLPFFRDGGCWVADQWPLQFLAGFPQRTDIAAHSSAGSRHGCRKSLGPENMHKDVDTDLFIVDDEWYWNMSGNCIWLSWSARWWSLSAPAWLCESLLLNKSNGSIPLLFTKTQ